MRAADLVKADIGAVVSFPVEDVVVVVGKILHVGHIWGMVRLGLTDADDESRFSEWILPAGKNVTLAREWVRMRSLNEPDLEQRGIYLVELARMARVMEDDE